MSLLLSPTLLYSLLAGAFTAFGYFGIQSYSKGKEIDELKSQLIVAQQDLNRCRTQQAVVQAEINKQASEISRYNSLAERYKKEAESKYQLQKTAQPCEFDFSAVNSLLMLQGVRR